MNWLIRKKSSKSSLSKNNFLKEEKKLKRKEARSIKGGTKSSRNRIWNGCGGTIPQ